MGRELANLGLCPFASWRITKERSAMKKSVLALFALLSAACSVEQGPDLDRTVCLGQGIDPGPVQEALDRWNPALAGWARLRLAPVGDVC